MQNIRNIAVFAHVDAGKTSVTEQLLFHSKTIRKLGSVANGDTQTDTLEVEKQRGITVHSSVLSFFWKNTKINLIDTPGHIDFSSETQKAFLAIDAAIVIVSAVEGIQAQTEHLINLLREAKKPFLIFINKIDRVGADIFAIIDELENDLHLPTFLMHAIENEATNEVSIQQNWSQETVLDHLLVEKIVAQDDELLAAFFEAKTLPFDTLDKTLAALTKEHVLTPVYIGSAKYALGITALLDGIANYLPPPAITSNELSGIIFKTYHLKDGKWLAVRLFSGLIKTRTRIHNASQDIVEKVAFIKSIDLNNAKIRDEIQAGEIALIKGLEQAKPGDYIGAQTNELHFRSLSKPLLSVQIIPDSASETTRLVDALTILNNEDPDLAFYYLKEEQEFHIKIHGEIQKEILQSMLLSRFNLAVTFSKPTVIYKETPTIASEGFVRYWMPKPCWAIMTFKIEPLETGMGVQYQSIVGVNDVKRQYQNDVQKMIPKALQQGVLGWEVDDLSITLIQGEDHEIHTKSNDFAIATPMGIMDGLTKSKNTLLEPILSFKIKTTHTFIGAIQSELVRLRAKIVLSEAQGDKVIIRGEIPLATSLDFPIKLNALTSGKAKLTLQFLNYQKCDIALGKTREYKGISPLDTAKYILKARKALS